MALWIVKNNGKISYGIKRYLCDTLEDLPYNENGEAVTPGSKAYVVSEKETFMMGSNGEWYQIEEGTGASSMAQLSDVDLTNLDDGQVLKYDEDNHKWVPSDDVSATSLGNLEDVDLTNLQDGQIIRYDRTTETWLASNIPSDIVELTQEQYDALPSADKNLPLIYEISDKGYSFYKGKKFRAFKELTQAEYDQLTPEEKNDGTEYLITDAPETVAELTQAQYDALTTAEKNNGTIWQISNKGYFFYKSKQFRASRELTQAEYDALTPEEKNNGTEYIITDATTSIGDIDDVSISGATDGQSLCYDATTKKWVPGNGIGPDISGKMDKVNPTGSGSFSLNRKSGTTIGTQSVAIGVETTASGNYSYAEGVNTTASGQYSHAEGQNTIASATHAHAEGAGTQASGQYSHAQGATTTASGNYSHAEGAGTEASGLYSHAEGMNTTASTHSAHAEGSNTTASGYYSHAEGLTTVASKNCAHAEGHETTASANYSHAEGSSTTASGVGAHAEGTDTTASGTNAHAEGNGTTASGNNSHAEGTGTIATGPNQHVGGVYNIVDVHENYAEIIGNGFGGGARSNARTLDWVGNESLAGTIDASGFGTRLSALIPEALSDLSDDTTHRTVTDTEKTVWDGKAIVKQMSVTDYEALPESEKMSEKVVYALPNADFYIPTIYGMRIKDNESVSAQKITYLNDASNMEAAYMDFTNNKFEYGSWANAFFMPRPCMLKYDGTVDYYLDPNDYYKKEDGAASDIDDFSYNGNAMIEWGQNGTRIWYKVVPDELDPKSCEVYVSNYKVNDTYKAWSFINNNGDLVDHFYTPIFNGTIDGSGRLRSISDKTYTDYCKSKTAAQEITAAQLNNPAGEDLWYTEVYCDVNLINYLLMLMSKNTDTQAAYGYGRSTVTASAEHMLDTGTMNTKGMFWGSNDGTSGVKVFGMENYWANQHRRLAGLLVENGVFYYKFTKGTEDGSTTSNYSTTVATGYLVGPTAATTSGYAKSMIYKSDGFYGCVDVSGGSDTTYYADYYSINTSGLQYAFRGGNCSSARGSGASYFYLVDAAGSTYSSIGAALSCKPKKNI